MAEPFVAAAAGANDDDNNGGGEKRPPPPPFDLPPGYYFQPTDTELMLHLKEKLLGGDRWSGVIPIMNGFGTNPDDFPFERSGSLEDTKGGLFHFFTENPRNNLATQHGYWSRVKEEEMRLGSLLDGYKKEYVYRRAGGEMTRLHIHQFSLNPAVYSAAGVDDNHKLRISNTVVCRVRDKGVPKPSRGRKRKQASI
ncbi:hypothetical protein ACH5RR_034224 [Cinchona calisaya]|uniref:NAC domain-containing protein n=1 Tax=Cinchona calisaya TaxID=153742 RepID=A0ABD2YBJ6_9GENT